MATKHRVIHGRRLLDALADAGIITTADKIRRVIIDAPCDGLTVIHVERFGDERLLDLTRTLDGIQIRTVDATDVTGPVTYAPHGCCGPDQDTANCECGCHPDKP